VTDSGRLPPELPDEASGEENSADMGGSADLAHLPGAVPDADLRALAPSARRVTAAGRAAQIEADRKMVACAAAENFDGPGTKKLLLAAFEYATPVVGSLVGTGRIFGACSRLGRPVKRRPGDSLWTEDDRVFMTERCVDTGIFGLFYEYGLRKGSWDAGRGTALTTYAVNACVLCFPPVYRKWWQGRELEHAFGDFTVDLPVRLQVDQFQPDPAERVANRLDAERLLMQMPGPVRTGLWLRGMEDETQADAALLVGLSVKALESRIGRARKKLGLPPASLRESGQDRGLPAGPEGDLDAQEGNRDREG
jgi:hypothetical protein